MPFLSHYVAMKLAFGEKLAKVYFGTLMISFLLLVFKILPSLYYLLIVCGFVAFVLDVYKFISKKYDLFYFETYTGNLDSNSRNVALDVFHSVEKSFGLYDEDDDIEDDDVSSEEVIVIDEDELENSSLLKEEVEGAFPLKDGEKEGEPEVSHDENANFNVDDLFYSSNDMDYFSNNDSNFQDNSLKEEESEKVDEKLENPKAGHNSGEKIFEEDDDIPIDFDVEKSISKDIEEEKEKKMKENHSVEGESDLMNLFK